MEDRSLGHLTIKHNPRYLAAQVGQVVQANIRGEVVNGRVESVVSHCGLRTLLLDSRRYVFNHHHFNEVFLVL